MRITISDYSKVIRRNVVLDDINFTFSSGKIYGLYGRNGSGKTMLLRAISGLIHSTKGSVCYDEKKLHEDMDFPDSMGIIIENSTLLPYYTGYMNLKILAGIRKVASDDDIKMSLSLLGLDPDSKKLVKEYSLGMKQRLNIAQAIFESPDIILLDEPTNSLDEESIGKVRKILDDIRKRDGLIILASHNKDDLKILSDEIITIVDGRIDSVKHQ